MTTARRTHAQRQVDAEDRLTQALAELIAEQGYERTTAAEIGERAGYSRAAVRDRYGSKDELLVAMHTRYERLLLGGADTAPPTSITEFVERFASFASTHPEWLRAIYVVSFEALGASHPFAPVVERWVATLERFATDLLRTQQTNGTIRTDIDPAAIGSQLLDEAIGGAYRWTLSGGTTDYAAKLRAFADRTLADLAPGPS